MHQCVHTKIHVVLYEQNASNSMGSSEFGIITMSVALKIHEAKPSEISIFNVTLVVFTCYSQAIPS